MGIVAAAIAVLMTAMRPPQEGGPQPLVVIYDVKLLKNDTLAYQACINMTKALYEDGALSTDKPVIYGNTSLPYLIYVIIYTPTGGTVGGVQILSPTTNTIIKVYTGQQNLLRGREAVCLFADKPYSGAKIKFVGASTTCVICNLQ
ncbi:hypothetical protein IPA_06655 [Ignicoccus pacificus DSM 13166]|uniref:Uncharacterized protein n=1 Tax=Ignicoccus pacificus DSM 13166 TaxID=940294 RepID=A0A977PLK6_9CREN|nr:hypothetical protein IPA_06655 [Ignicoccus pacificus DSM 13166]